MGPAIAAVLLLALSGCHWAARPQHPEDAPGRWYVVEPGESLGDIARRGGVPEEDLLEVNGLSDVSQVVAGKLIFVLDGPGGPMPDKVKAPGVAAPQSPPPPIAGARLRWPVDAPRVTSFFGKRWGRAHEGIDLNAPVGTPVHAADAGEVVYSGNTIRGYGNMVVLKHTGDLMTVYAHNSVLVVKVGDSVAVGQRVALSGQSGHATGPHVHFEVRRGQIPRDPIPYLPDLRGAKDRIPRS